MATTALQAAALTMLAFSAAAQPAATARPTGGQVVGGSASISQTAAQTTVAQSSQRAAVDWRSFDVGSQHTVSYQQPNASAITLNRVTGPDMSQIAGKIQANGQVVIVNQSGVTFYKGSQVDVQSLVVSTAGISNRNFMAGKMVFDQPGRPGAQISNAGTITVKETGLAALVAPRVANSGVINARMGHVVLAGAEAHTVDLYGDGLMSVDVTREVRTRPDGGKELVTNSGTINADGGTVVLTARAADGLVTNLVSNTGKLRANTVDGKTGTIVVSAIGGSISVEGDVQTNGRTPGSVGGTVQLAATDTVTVKAGARVTANGRAGGGVVAVGTTPARAVAQSGGVPDQAARAVVIEAGARISADGRGTGSGGKIAVMGRESTQMAGRLTAKGGKSGGDGGQIEISARERLGITGTVDTSAPKGRTGTLTIDPDDLVIGGATTDPASPDPGGTGAPATGTQSISANTFNGFNANVNLSATNTITIGDTGVALGQGANTIALHAGTTLTVTGLGISQTGAVTLTGGTAINLNAPVSIGTATLTLNGGAITQTGGGAITAGTLTGSGSSVSLMAGNQIGTVSNLSATGALNLFDATPLAVSGTVSGTGVALTSQAITFNAGSVVGAGATGLVAIKTDALTVSGTSTFSAGTVAVAPATARALVVGGTPATGDLTLDPLALQSMTVAGGRLNLGSIDASPSAANATATSVTMNAPLNLGSTVTLGLYATGAVSQTDGPTPAIITAGTLTGQSGAGTSLGLANVIGTLGSYGTTGNLILATGGTPLQIAGAVVVGGGGTLNLTTGALTQTAGSSVSASLLNGSASSVDLTTSSTNAIGSIGPFTSSGGFALKTSGALTVADAIKDDTAVALTGSTIAVNAAIGPNAAASLPSVSLTGTNGISQTAGGSVTTAALTVSAPTGAITMGGSNAAGSVALSSTAGDIAFRNGSALSVGAISTAGSASFFAPSLSVAGTVNVGTALRLQTDALAFSGGTVGTPTLAIAPLTAGALTVDATDQTAAGRLSVLASSLTAAALPGTTRLILGSADAAPTAANATATSIAFNTPTTVGPATLSLYSTGGVTQDGTAVLTANTLSGAVGGNANFSTAANKVGTLGSLSAAGYLVLNNTGLSTLTVAGTASTGAGGTLRLSVGSLTLAGTSVLQPGTGGRVELQTNALTIASGAQVQAAGSVVAVAPLSAGAVSIDGSKVAGRLSLTQADLDALANAGSPPAALVLGNTDAGLASAATTATSITVNGAANTHGAGLGLYSTGAVTQGAGAVITAGALSGRAASVNLTTAANAIAGLGNVEATSGAFALRNAATQHLDVSGTVTTLAGSSIALTGGTVTLKSTSVLNPGANGRVQLRVDGLTAEPGALVQAAGGTVAVAPDTASVLSLGAGSGLVLSQTVLDALAPSTGAPARLVLGDVSATPAAATATATSIAVGSTVAVNAGTLALYTPGAVSQTAGQALTVGTLTGGVGALALADADNGVSTLGTLASAGAVRLRNGAGTGLTVAGTVTAAAGSPIRLQAPSLTLAAGSALIASGAGSSIGLGTDSLTLGGGLVSDVNGTVALAPYTVGTDMTLGAVYGGTLSLTQAQLAQLAPFGGPAVLALGSLDSGTTTTAGMITFAGPVAIYAPTLALYSTGLVSQAPGAVLTAQTLTGTVGTLNLTSAQNAVTNLDGMTATGNRLTLDDRGSASLTVNGTIKTADAGTVRLQAAGLVLSAGSTLQPGAAGAVELSADTLSMGAGAGVVAPEGTVAVAPNAGGMSIGSGSGLVLTQAQIDALSPTGANQLAGLVLGSSYTAAPTAANATASSITLNSSLTANAPALGFYSTGVVTGAGAVTAGTLVGEAGSFALSGANHVGVLGHMTATAGSILLADASALTVGAANGAAGDGQVSATANVQVNAGGLLTLVAPTAGTAATVTTQNGNIILTGASLAVQGALIGACSTGSLTTGNTTLGGGTGTITVASGTVGGMRSVGLTASGGTTLSGGLVNAPEADIGNGPFTLTGGTLRAETVRFTAASATVDGGTLQTNSLLDGSSNPYMGLTYLSGGLSYGGTGTLTAAVGPTLSGSITSAAGLTLNRSGSLDSSGTLIAGGALLITSPGGMTQSAGLIAGDTVTITSTAGVINQAAGASMQANTLLQLRASGSGSAAVLGALGAATVRVMQPNATLTVNPASLTGAATLALTSQSLAYTCPGCISPGGFTVPVGGTAAPGAYRPAALRADGGTLLLGAVGGTSALAADVIELHSTGATQQLGGTLVANSLSGTAGYAGTDDLVPDYGTAAPQTRNGSGGYTLAGTVNGATVTLGSAGNNIGALTGYQVRGDDASRAGLVFVDTPGAQVDSTGATVTPAGLTLSGTVRGGPRTDPLDASAALATGNDVSITVLGAGLDTGAAVVAGRMVALNAAGTITEGAAGSIVAGTLTGAAGAGATFDVATSGAAGQIGNQVAQLGPFTAGSGAFVLRDSRSLAVVGAVSGTAVTLTAQSGAGTPSVAEGQSAGNLTVSAQVSGADVGLTAYGAISGAGVVADDTVSVLAGGGVSLGVSAQRVTGAAGGTLALSGDFAVADSLTAGGALTLTDSGLTRAPALTLSGASSAVLGATILAPAITSTGTLYAGGDIRLRATSGDFVQTAGTIGAQGMLYVTGASDTAAVGGSIAQAGVMAGQGGALLLATGSASEAAGAALYAPSATVVALGGDNTYGITSTATVVQPTGGVAVAGVLPVYTAGTAGSTTVGAASATVRLDGATLTLPRAVTGTTSVTLHSTGSTGTASPAGLITAGVLTGTAGYQRTGTDAAGLPTYSPTVAGSATGGTVALTNAGNQIAQAGPYYADGAFSLSDARSLTVVGPVRAGDASRPGTAAEMANTGAALTLAMTGPGLTLAIGDGTHPDGSLLGRTVTLGGAGLAVTENGVGTIVANTLTTVGTSVGSAALGGLNQVGTLGEFTATAGGISLLNAGNLLVGARDMTGGTLNADAGTGTVSAQGTIAIAAQAGNGTAGALTVLAAAGAAAPVIISQTGDVTLGGTTISLHAALISACAPMQIGLNTPGALTIDNGSVLGTPGSIGLYAGQSVTVTGASLVNAATVTVGNPGTPFTLTGNSRLLGQTVTLQGPATMDAGTTLHAATLNVLQGLTFDGGDLFTNSNLSLTTGATLAAGDQIVTGGGLSLDGLLDSSGTIVAGGALSIRAHGDFVQHEGTLAGSSLTVQADGTIGQDATGQMLAAGTLLLRGNGSGAASVLGALSGAAIQVIEPSATLTLSPAAFGTAGTTVLRGAATVSTSLGTLSISCPGCADTGTGSYPVASSVAAGSNRPGALRVDAGTLVLGNGAAVAIAGDTIELHALGTISEAAGATLVGTSLSGSAGYVGTLASAFALPDFSAAFGTPQVRTGSGYVVSPPLGVATVTLTNTGNNVAQITGFQVRDAAGTGFQFADTPAAQTDSTGASMAPTGLTLTGSLRGGPGTDPLDASAALATGNDVAIQVLGPNGTLALNGALLSGRTVTLQADQSITEAAGSALVAGTLTGSAGTGASFNVATSGSGSATGNQVARLGAFTAAGGDFLLRNSRSLSVTGPVSAAGTTTILTQSGAGTPSVAEGQSAGNLALGATVGGANVDLVAHGSITGSMIQTPGLASLLAGQDVGVTVNAGTVGGAAGGTFAASGTFGSASAQAGGDVRLTDSIALALTGATAGGSVTVQAPGVTSSGNVFAGTDAAFRITSGDFVQTGGTIVAGTVSPSGTLSVTGASGTVPLPGKIEQLAGTMAATGQALLYATTGAHQAASGAALYAPVATVIALDPVGGAAVNDFAVSLRPGTVTAPGGGLDTSGVLPVVVSGPAGTVTAGAAAATVRLDGDVLAVSRTVAGTGSVTLHSTRDTTVTGAVQTASLSGTAGYAPDGLDTAGLPTYGTLTAATSRGGSASFTNSANAIGTLGTYQARTALTLQNAQSLATSGIVRAGLASAPATVPLADGGALTLTLTGAGSALALGANSLLAGDVVTLTVPGSITQGTGSTVVANTLTGAAGLVTLTQANQVASLGAFTSAGNFSLTDATALAVTGAVQAGAAPPASGSTLTLNVGGGLSLNGGSLTAGTVGLTAAGEITEPNGFIVANSLTASGTAFTANSAQNQVAQVAGLTAPGGISFVDAPIGGLLTVAGPVSASAGPVALNVTGSVLVQADVTAGGAVSIADSGTLTQQSGTIGGASVDLESQGAVSLAGTVSGPNGITVRGPTVAVSGTVAGGPVLVAATNGGFNESTAGVITGSSLVSTSTGLTSLAGTVTTAGAMTVGANGLTVGGRLTSTAGNVGLDGGTGDMLVPGSVAASAGTVSMRTNGQAQVAGTVTAGQAVNLAAGGPVSVTGRIAGPTGVAVTGSGLTVNGTLAGGPVTLTANNGGVTEGGSGTITGSSLVSTSTGVTSLAGTVTTAGAMTVGANGLVVGGTLTSNAGSIGLNGGSGDLLLPGTVRAAGNVAMQTNGQAQVAGTVTAGQAVNLAAGGPVSVTGSIAGPGGVTVTGSALTVNGALAGGPVTLAANNGGITEGGSGTVTGSSLVSNSTGATSLAGLAAFGTGVSVAGNGVTVGGTLTSGTGDVTLAGQNGGVSVTGVVRSGGAAAVSANGTIGVSGTMGATGAVTLNGGALTVPGTVSGQTVASVTTGVTQVDGLISGPGGIAVQTGDLVVNGVLQGGPVTIAATGGVAQSASGHIRGSTLGSQSNGATVLAGEVAVDGPVAMTAVGLTAAGVLTSQSGAVTLNATTGGITVSGTVSAPASVRLLGDGADLLAAGSAVTSGTSVTVAAGTRPPTVAIEGLATSATLGGTVGTPRLVVAAETITLQGGALTAGGVVQRSGTLATALPTAGQNGPGIYLQAGNAFAQTGTTVIGTLAPSTETTVRVDLVSGTGTVALGTLSARTSNLIIDLGNGSAKGGPITVNNLFVLRSATSVVGSGVDITGSIGNQAGTAAAGLAQIAPTPNQNYRVNNCAIGSINCVVLRPDAIPVFNPLKELSLNLFRDQDDADELLVPNVTEQGL